MRPHARGNTMATVVPEGVHAFFFVDPGGTSGVAAAHIELGPTLKSTFEQGVIMKKTVEVEGPWLVQANVLGEMIERFIYVAQAEKGIPSDRIHIGFENYTRRPGSKDNNLEPVYVIAGTQGLLWAKGWKTIDFILQEPSEAKGFARNERLKLWGLWEVGSEHKRDAMRHLAYRVNRVLGTV